METKELEHYMWKTLRALGLSPSPVDGDSWLCEDSRVVRILRQKARVAAQLSGRWHFAPTDQKKFDKFCDDHVKPMIAELKSH